MTTPGKQAKEVKLTEAIGKTLAAVAFGGFVVADSKCVLVFTDGTFATLGIEHGYEAGDEYICETTLDVLNFGDDALIRAGVMSSDELAAMRKEQKRQHIAEENARERQEFERLKRKFHGNEQA